MEISRHRSEFILGCESFQQRHVLGDHADVRDPPNFSIPRMLLHPINHFNSWWGNEIQVIREADIHWEATSRTQLRRMGDMVLETSTGGAFTGLLRKDEFFKKLRIITNRASEVDTK